MPNALPGRVTHGAATHGWAARLRLLCGATRLLCGATLLLCGAALALGVALAVGPAPALARGGDAGSAPVAENWLFLPWDHAVGRVEGREADSEGPKSFAVTPDGGVLLLDQVNLRILDLGPGGALLGTIPLPAATFDDVEQYRFEAVLALDRLGAQALLVLDWQGTPLAEVPLRGRGIEHPGRVTALLPRDDGVWLEVSHRYSVKVLDRWLVPCERQIVLGRPLSGHRSLHGALDGQGGARIGIRRRNQRPRRAAAPAYARLTVKGDDPIRRIVWLDEDPDGHVVAALHEARFADRSPYRVIDERYQLVRLAGGDRDETPLAVRDRLRSPWVLTGYDQRGEIRVGPDGRLWQLAYAPDGVLLLRWDWRRP